MVRIADIITESIVDGEGYRMAIFFQGCKHGCKGCHNPQTWDFNGGEELSTSDILSKYNYDIMDGVTLTGGDPFYQAKEILDIVKTLKDNNVNIWAYTGFIFDEFLNYINNDKCDESINGDMIELLKYIDVVVDGPFILEKRSLDILYRGSTNQRLIDVKKSLASNKIIEYIPEE